MEEEEDIDLVVTLRLGAAAGGLEFFSWVTFVMRSLLLFITCCSFCCHFLLADCRARRRSCSSDSSSSSFSATGGCSIPNKHKVKPGTSWRQDVNELASASPYRKRWQSPHWKPRSHSDRNRPSWFSHLSWLPQHRADKFSFLPILCLHLPLLSPLYFCFLHQLDTGGEITRKSEQKSFPYCYSVRLVPFPLLYDMHFFSFDTS